MRNKVRHLGERPPTERGKLSSGFLECVCGASAWKKAKTEHLISEARDRSQLKVVSASDETFALL